ncbi:hypothetical protein LRS06_01365 [Hymenobacter sp. J193]|uniref:hypothetical protein n=1 Tax=Hymenobacter sp. J193 TaxID=2898429 RepID=UPI002151A1F8|nr:hypothetical protein [Hymenobacter sp. J193]MCR5886442.1 hypothetical protein [Hymenobacter sp. J193]
MPARPEAGQASFWWQHPTRALGLRLHYRLDDNLTLLGLNALGLRLRHEVCDGWLLQGASVRHALERLGAANFDPELFPQYEAAILAAFNQQHPEQPPLVLRRRKGLLARLLSV